MISSRHIYVLHTAGVLSVHEELGVVAPVVRSDMCLQSYSLYKVWTLFVAGCTISKLGIE